jgi:hypothetical protein
VVKTSNRDLVNWDRMRMRLKYGGGSDSPFIFAAFLAWSAASRSGDFAGPFDAAGGFLDSAEDITNLVLTSAWARTPTSALPSRQRVPSDRRAVASHRNTVRRPGGRTGRGYRHLCGPD